MALVTYSSNDPVLVNLLLKFADLESELSLIQDEYQKLQQAQTQRCSTALSNATTSLLDVIQYVNEADRALIYWYEKGTTVKMALRLVGMDKRTKSIVAKKTQKMKTKTATTEAQFIQTTGVFRDGLKAVQTLDSRVNHYSISKLCSARAQASEAHNQVDSDAKCAELSLQRVRAKQKTVESELGDIPGRMHGARAQRQSAQNNLGTTGTVSEPCHLTPILEYANGH